MNTSMIRKILGQVLMSEGAFMLLPCLVSLVYREHEGLAFLITAFVTFSLGFLLNLKKPKTTNIYIKDGLVVTGLSWIAMTLFGGIPFVLTGEIPSFVDAMFETASGLSTTGASILTDIESMSHTALMWRSLTHFIGGMGVLVFLLAILPSSGGSTINLMRAESPGPSVGKVVPKISVTARLLYSIYISLTAIEIILLIAGGMPVFDSICHAFGTAGTGGFGVKNDSFMSYSPYCQYVAAVFMYLFAMNFNFYSFLLLKQFKKAFGMEEIIVYVSITIVTVSIVTLNIFPLTGTFSDSFRESFFTIGSIMSTTGFSNADFDKWPMVSRFILVVLMFSGACAGSTGGGIKVSRIHILAKTIGKSLKGYFHPNNIKKIQMDGHPIEHEVIRSVNVYLATFLCVFTLSVFVISFENMDPVTTFTSVAATINNIGPGLAGVGPTCNYADFSVLSKIVFIFDMLAGRLELFPLLVFISPDFYKAALGSIKTKIKKSKA